MKCFLFLCIILFIWHRAHGLEATDFHPGYAVDVIGYSVMEQPLYAVYNVSTAHLPPVLVLFNIHGNENSGY